MGPTSVITYLSCHVIGIRPMFKAFKGANAISQLCGGHKVGDKMVARNLLMVLELEHD